TLPQRHRGQGHADDRPNPSEGKTAQPARFHQHLAGSSTLGRSVTATPRPTTEDNGHPQSNEKSRGLQILCSLPSGLLRPSLIIGFALSLRRYARRALESIR